MNCLGKIKKIESFISDHESDGVTAEELERLRKQNNVLEEQFRRMEVGWETDRRGIEEDSILEELEKIVATTDNAVDATLVVSRRFIKEKSVQISAKVASPAVASALPTIRVKLPVFWTEECDLWFSKVEATFREMNVTSEMSKYNQVVAQLDETTAAFASDILKADQKEEDRPYDKLKKRILEVLSLSVNEKADKLLDLNGFGDKIPSQGLQAMLKLVPAAEAENPGFLFRRIFLRQLTPDVRNNLAQTEHTASTVDSLRQLAKQADRYYHSTGARINAIVRHSELVAEDSSVDAVTGKVLCWNHKKFGVRAWKCGKANGARCDWTGKPPQKPQGKANGRA